MTATITMKKIILMDIIMTNMAIKIKIMEEATKTTRAKEATMENVNFTLFIT